MRRCYRVWAGCFGVVGFGFWVRFMVCFWLLRSSTWIAHSDGLGVFLGEEDG